MRIARGSADKNRCAVWREGSWRYDDDLANPQLRWIFRRGEKRASEFRSSVTDFPVQRDAAVRVRETATVRERRGSCRGRDALKKKTTVRRSPPAATCARQ